MRRAWRRRNSAWYARLSHVPTYLVSYIRQAQICGLNIIVHAEELPAIVQAYEKRGHFEEILQLLEAGLSLERAHVSSQSTKDIDETKLTNAPPDGYIH
jgi:hypothetical protein